MATTLAPPLTTNPRRRAGKLPAKRNIGAIEHDPVRFSSAPLLFAAIAFAAGILIASRWWIPPAWLGIAALLEGLLTVTATRWHPRTALLPLATTWLLLGGFAAEVQSHPAPQTQLRHLAQGTPVTVTGTVLRVSPVRRVVSYRPFSDEQIIEQVQSIDLHVLSAAEPGDTRQPVNGGLRLSLYAPADAATPAIGCNDLVTVTATIRPPERYRDPGVWDSPAWMLNQGIGVIGSAKAERLTRTHGSGYSFACIQHVLQTAASDRLVQFADAPPAHALPAWLTLSHDDAAMLAAMVTGDRTYLRTDLRTPFERTGSFHLLVVSGLHLGIFAAFIFAIGRRLRVNHLPLTAVTILLSFAYAVLTGFGQPVQRAFAMVALYLIGRLIYRDRARLNSLGFAALCLLIFNPQALFDAGLQMTLLTVVAVAGIAIPIMERTSAPFIATSRSIDAVGMDTAFEPRLAQFRVTLRLLGEHLEPILSRRRYRRTRYAQNALAFAIRWSLLLFDLCLVSAAIELVMALPMAAYFHRVTTSGLLVNVLIVPALTLLLPAALLTTVALLATPHIAWIPAAAAAALLHAILVIVHTAGAWRMSELRLSGPGLAATLTSLTLLAFAVWIVRTRRKFAIPAGAIALLGATACVLAPHSPAYRANALEVSAIDVGQGDSILVVSPDGHTMLVDAGGPTGGTARESKFDIGEQVVSPYLWNRHIQHLDIVVLTHAHSDHMGGMPAILRNFRPRELWVGHNPAIPAYQQLLREAASLGVKIRPFSAGDTIPFGGTTVRVLAPASDYQPGTSASNNDSLVLHLSYAGHSALLEGDAESPSEAAMLSLSPQYLASDLLKVGHHGSKTSTIPPFLARVAPHFAVISVGPYNSYHQQEGAHTWRTDLLGLSSFYIDSTGVHPVHLP